MSPLSSTSHNTESISKDLQNSNLLHQLFAKNESEKLLNVSDFNQLAKAVKRRQIPPNTSLFQQGETGMNAGILVKGKLFGEIAYKDLGKPVTFEIKEGDLFGEISLVTGLKRNASIYTEAEGAEILELSVESFAILLSLHPDIPHLLTRMIEQRYEANKAQYRSLQSVSAKEVKKKFKRKNLLTRFLDTLISADKIPSFFPQIETGSTDKKLFRLAESLQQSDLFAKILTDSHGNSLLSGQAVYQFCKRTKLLHFKEKKRIFRQYDKSDSAYIVVKGKVECKVEFLTTQKTQTFKLGQGSIFGEMSLLTGQVRSASIRAMKNAELLEINTNDFAYLLKLHPKVSAVLLELVVQRKNANLASQQTLEEQEAFKKEVLHRFEQTGMKAFGQFAKMSSTAFDYLGTKAEKKKLEEVLSSMFLEGNFAPVKEELEVENLSVIGEIPPELDGIYIRNGPNPQFQPIGRHHWFDGDGMLHSVELKDGKATYRNKFIETEGFLIEKKEGKAIWSGLLELPQFEAPHGLVMKNVGNTGLVWHHNRFLALYEAGMPYEIKLPSLETVGEYDFDKHWDTCFSAHPRIDPKTGEMFGFKCNPISAPFLEYGIFSPDGKLKRKEVIDIPHAVSIHDFAITPNYIVFFIPPLRYSIAKVLQNQLPWVFDIEGKCRIAVVPRYGKGGDVQWLEIPACMVFHLLNAYEENGKIHVFGCKANATTMLIPLNEDGTPFNDSFGGNNIDIKHYLYHWELDLATKEVQEERLSDATLEFPMLNGLYLGQKMRYAYFANVGEWTLQNHRFGGVAKYDFEEGKITIHHFAAHEFGGEPFFVARPNAVEEDDGWILCFVYNEQTNGSELLILEAQNIEILPVARIQMPRRVPFGFHGIWVSEKDMKVK
ncbi:MAG: carotenoid oxygenase family protein [Chitinophagales bacterium]